MPRRYRPPTRRRKPKRERLPGEPPPSPPRFEEEAAERPSPPPAPAADQLPSVPRETAAEQPRIVRDYSYVVGELRLIAIIIVMIIAGLVITAVLR